MKYLFLLISFALSLLFIRFISFYQALPVYEDGQQVNLQVILQETPKLNAQGQRFTVKTRENTRISIQTNLKRDYHYGQSLAITGQLQVAKLDNGYEFFSLYYPEITVLEQDKNLLFEASRWVREKSITLFQSVLPSISSSLLLGIVFGSDESFPKDFKKALQETGVLHVVAASGMNVAFFTGAVMFSLGSFLKRRVALFLTIFVVIFYSFLVGFQPSILRASFMALIAITASFFGRQNFAFFSIFVAGFGMLLWSPAFLFDVGFQLSFLATLGILLIGERLDQIRWIGKLGILKEDLKTTVSAQLATFPILLGTFGSVGILGLVVNMLVLWTVPILMLLGFLAVLTGIFIPFIGKALLFVALPFLLFFEYIVSFFGSFHLNLSFENFPWQFAVGYYLVLLSVILLLKKKVSQQK